MELTYPFGTALAKAKSEYTIVLKADEEVGQARNFSGNLARPDKRILEQDIGRD